MGKNVEEYDNNAEESTLFKAQVETVIYFHHIVPMVLSHQPDAKCKNEIKKKNHDRAFHGFFNLIFQAGMVAECVVGDPPQLASDSQLHGDMQITVSTHAVPYITHSASGPFSPKLLNLDTSHVLKMQGKGRKNWEEKMMGHVSVTLPSSSSCF